MGSVVSFTDAEEAARAWVNDPAVNLSGPTKPFTNGAHLSIRNGSPGHATFCVIGRLTSGDDPGGMPMDAPRLTFACYGPDKVRAAAAALALANALRSLAGNPRTYTGKGRLLHASRVSLVEVPDGTHARYVVDADLAVAPA